MTVLAACSRCLGGLCTKCDASTRYNPVPRAAVCHRTPGKVDVDASLDAVNAAAASTSETSKKQQASSMQPQQQRQSKSKSKQQQQASVPSLSSSSSPVTDNQKSAAKSNASRVSNDELVSRVLAADPASLRQAPVSDGESKKSPADRATERERLAAFEQKSASQLDASESAMSRTDLNRRAALSAQVAVDAPTFNSFAFWSSSSYLADDALPPL